MKKSTKYFTILLFLIGILLLLYPQVSNFLVQRKQNKIIRSYLDTLNIISDEKYQRVYEEAVKYNEELYEKAESYPTTDEDIYNNILKIDNSGIMGYLEIPKVNMRLSIYHGTDDSVLQVGIGHLSNSSVPIGGENTHTILFGHRGLPSAKLFTDLDKMVVGDTFIINVLNEKLYYEITDIIVMEPEALLSEIRIEEGKDLATLVTCTPYGINSHRLVLKSKRIEAPTEQITVRTQKVITNQNSRSKLNYNAVIAGVLLGIVAGSLVLITDKKRRKKSAKK